MYDNTLSLAEFDKELAQAIQDEESRQEDRPANPRHWPGWKRRARRRLRSGS